MYRAAVAVLLVALVLWLASKCPAYWAAAHQQLQQAAAHHG